MWKERLLEKSLQIYMYRADDSKAQETRLIVLVFVRAYIQVEIIKGRTVKYSDKSLESAIACS